MPEEDSPMVQASVSLSKPLSLRWPNPPPMPLLVAVPLLSEPKLFRLSPSLDDLPGVGEAGGESQLMSRSGVV